ncbi:MAG: LPS export ABC transporter permease LptG [Bdellovibrionia bacterium]
MRILDRYIIGIFVKHLIVAILAMSILFLFQSMFSDLYDHNNPINQVIYYHWLNIPQIAVQMCPPAVLLATVLTLSGLSRTHEIVACYSIGVGLRRLMALILGVVLTVSCLLLVIQDRILPPVFKKRTNFYWREMQKRPDFFVDIKRDKVWYRSKNMIYNLQLFDMNSKTIHGMALYTFDDDFNLLQVVNAERAEYMEGKWKLENGIVTMFSKDSPFPMSQNFTEKEVVIAETPKDFQEIEKEVDGLRSNELHQYIERMKKAGADTKSYAVKYHARFSMSFIPIVMCFLAIPFSLTKRREGGAAKDLGLCLVLTFFYWLFYSVGLSLGTNGALPPWLAAWLPSSIFVVLAATLIARKS